MTDYLLEDTKKSLQSFQLNNGRLLQRLYKEGQQPAVLLITFVDSRVLPEQMLGLQPGQYLLLRNVGNVVPPAQQREASVTATLEFAVTELQVSNIVVCGHTDCGGLKAALEGVNSATHPALANWLRPVQRAPYAAKGRVRRGSEKEQALSLSGEHVVQQLAHLKSHLFVWRALEAGTLSLHGWVYDIEESAVHYYDQQAAAFFKFPIDETM